MYTPTNHTVFSYDGMVFHPFVFTSPYALRWKPDASNFFFHSFSLIESTTSIVSLTHFLILGVRVFHEDRRCAFAPASGEFKRLLP